MEKDGISEKDAIEKKDDSKLSTYKAVGRM
jgi:hypothetical protein